MLLRKLVVTLAVLVGSVPVRAADWPMSGFEPGRRSATPLDLPEKLYLQWVRDLPALRPAWPDQNKMQFDSAYDPIVLGKTMFVGSSRCDSVTAFDTATGAEKWRFFADGPIRFAPVGWENRVYFVSDDGYLYCVGAEKGNLLWKFRGGAGDRKILGNDRLISTWPARGAPVIADGTVYFAASIWPFMGIFIHALDARTGAVQWTNDGDGSLYMKQPHYTDAFASVAPQGPLVAIGESLLIPGGRSVPACFERKTGKLQRYQLSENGKRGGGAEVIATLRKKAAADNQTDDPEEQHGFFFNGGAAFDLATEKYLGEIGKPVVLSGDIVFAYSAGALRAYDLKSAPMPDEAEKPAAARTKVVAPKGNKWSVDELASCKTPVVECLIKAGSRLFAGTTDQIFAVDLAPSATEMNIGWTRDVDGTVVRLLAADNRLFAVTREGRIYCFGPARTEVARHAPTAVPPAEDAWTRKARHLLEASKVRDGYCVVWGAGNGRLLAELARQSSLHVIAIEPDAKKVQALRSQLQADDLCGHRVALLTGDANSVQLPPYLASLMIAEDLSGFTPDATFLSRAYASLRPYGGVFCLEGPARLAGPTGMADLAKKLEGAEVRQDGDSTWIVRPGALPGSANWTHEHADAASTRVSRDRLVKAPLGLLWFGGPSHEGILPRHGHGPQPQVVDGRVLIEGVDLLRAMDIYTGRLLWEADLPGVGQFFNNLAHQPGANASGSNFVSLPDGIYVAHKNTCVVLDPATGKKLRTFHQPDFPGQKTFLWGYINVADDFLVGGADPLLDPKSMPPREQPPGFGDDSSEKRKESLLSKVVKTLRVFNDNMSSSKHLVVMNRHTGKVLWTATAQLGFRHNATCIGGGRLYTIDRLSGIQLSKLKTETDETPKARLRVYDLKTGKELWNISPQALDAEDGEIFGTWLSYSAKHDILLEAGRVARDSLTDEPRGMRAYQAKTGKVLWYRKNYAGPAMIHGDTVLQEQGGCDILTGELKLREDPITGQYVPWRWTRNHGCNTPAASEHLLTFRSGAAGYFDYCNDGGTGNFGGFRSSCTNNLIVAGGVLTAPEYTRTCTCAYQNQSSVGMIHMPEAEMWTFFGTKDVKGPLRRVGVNLGAPGDRKAENGTLWLEYPSVAGVSPFLAIATKPEELQFFRRHSSAVQGPMNWVAASGARGLSQLILHVGNTEPRPYTVRLFFAEPDRLAGGKRVFAVHLQGKEVIEELDIAREAGGSSRTLIKEFTQIMVQEDLTIRLTASDHAAVQETILCGIEIIAEGKK